jgi:hypothetical protein
MNATTTPKKYLRVMRDLSKPGCPFFVEEYQPHKFKEHHSSALVFADEATVVAALPKLNAMPRWKVGRLDEIAAALRALGFADAHYVSSY